MVKPPVLKTGVYAEKRHWGSNPSSSARYFTSNAQAQRGSYRYQRFQVKESRESSFSPY